MPKKKINYKKSSKGKEIEDPESQAQGAMALPQGAALGIGPNGVPRFRMMNQKLSNTDLPKGFEKPELDLREITESNKPPDHTERITTIPPKYLKNPQDDPDRHTECLITGTAKNRLFACPSFLTQRVPEPYPNTVVIKESPTGGMGMFAGRDIHYGELLIAERPLLMTPATLRGPVDGYSYEDRIKIVCFAREQQLEVVFNRMDGDRKEAYMALANSHKEDGSGPLLGVQRTNGFGIDLNEVTRNGGIGCEGEEMMGRLAGMNLSESQLADLKVKEETDMYSVIANEASRINHSCSPNIGVEFSVASFSLQIRAARDIKEGEEIFHTYTGVTAPTAKRRKQLEPYGFTCACKACALATPESDKFRQNSFKYMKILETLYQTVKDNDLTKDNGMQSVRETILPKLLEFRRKLKEEGLDAMSGPYLRSTILLQDVYISLGMMEDPEMKSIMGSLSIWMMIKAGFLERFASTVQGLQGPTSVE